jgi:predicted dinucleotide-binding enzyme
MWVKAGHEVMFSSLDLEKDKALAASLGSGALARAKEFDPGTPVYGKTLTAAELRRGLGLGS